MDGREPSSFGDLLRALRKRKHFTQQQLAGRLGLHRNTIGTWEQGEFLPDTRGMVLELARQLHLDDQETRQLLEASLTTLVPYWNIPSPRNPFFTGREEVLEELHQNLHVDHVVALTQSSALHGLGGIGKTQVAVEYAYRHALSYTAVFWIVAETSESILSSFLTIAELLSLPERELADQQRIVAAVQRWLNTHTGWLLIWDNLEDLELLPRFLPLAWQGAILITTRAQAFGTLAQGIELPTMGQEEGMALLLRRAKVISPQAPSEQMRQLAARVPTDYAAAQELVTVLGGLPLALDQAGAYIEETGCSPSDYLQRYEQQRALLLARRAVPAGDHPHSVAATLSLACVQAAQQNPASTELLHLCAFLHPDAIPEESIVAGAADLGAALQPVAAGPYQLDQTITTLRTFSLIRRYAQTRTLSIHRLVQAVLQEGMSEQEREQGQQRALGVLSATFPEVTPEAWGQCERLLPHVLMCAAAMPDQAGNPKLAEVLCKAADYLCARGKYEQAEPFYQRALTIREQQLGLEHPDVAETLHGLADLYLAQGKYEQAEPFYQRALTIRERRLGSTHRQTAKSLDGLAILYERQGKYEQAEPFYQCALAIREQHLGSEHPDVAETLSNLGGLYLKQGKYTQAEPFYQRMLAIGEQQLGSTHPGIATYLNNFARLYHLQRKYEQAEPLVQRALAIYEQQLGPTHPFTATGLQNLARLCQLQNKDEQAEALYLRAIAICKQQLGLAHPETAQSLAGLARLYQKQGSFEQAEPLLQQACTIFEQRLGQGHPETVKAMEDYHRLFEQKRRAEETLIDEQQEHAKSLQDIFHQSSSPLSAPLEEAPAGTGLEADPLTDFLDTCCELHPRAWSRASDLWRAYEQWVKEHQQRFPLSRRAFTAQLKAHGCWADRTNTARVWRGIAVMHKDR